jgi:hypothetical protein
VKQPDDDLEQEQEQQSIATYGEASSLRVSPPSDGSSARTDGAR